MSVKCKDCYSSKQCRAKGHPEALAAIERHAEAKARRQSADEHRAQAFAQAAHSGAMRAQAQQSGLAMQQAAMANRVDPDRFWGAAQQGAMRAIGQQIADTHQRISQAYGAINDGFRLNGAPVPRAKVVNTSDFAFALFKADPDVQAFAALKGETKEGPRYDRALRIAYERDEHGWRTKFIDQAARAAQQLEARK